MPEKNTPGTAEPLKTPVPVEKLTLTVGPEVYRPKLAARTLVFTVDEPTAPLNAVEANAAVTVPLNGLQRR